MRIFLMKMSSIRSFLLASLLLGELFSILLVVGIILFWGHTQVQAKIDGRLMRTAFLLQSFLDQPEDLRDLAGVQRSLFFLRSLISSEPSDEFESYSSLDSGLSLHVSDASGRVLLNSQEMLPSYILQHGSPGFSDFTFNDISWRVFATIDPNSQSKIMVLQRKDSSQLIPIHILQEVFLIVLISYPILVLLIWLILNRGLRALNLVCKQIQNQSMEHFSYIDSDDLPSEIKPIAEEWNKLFDRLKFTLDREKRFAGDAAHELKTPLAALKTHTQLALNAKNDNELTNALHKIIAGVNRSAHVVQQLLTLNRINHGLMIETPTPIDLTERARETIAELVPQAFEKNTEIELIAPDIPPIIEGHGTAIGILIRNLVDNAIRYSPENSFIQVIIEQHLNKECVLLKVIDNGPGIPEHLRERVFERFFRVIGNKASGSGLGMGIVQQIVELHNAKISLEMPENGQGLQVNVEFYTHRKSAKAK